MDFGKLLTRSFEIARKYRTLWFFGILLALFGEGSAGGGGGNIGFPGTPGRDGASRSEPFSQLPGFNPDLILPVIGILACVAIIGTIAGIFFKFTSRGALIGLCRSWKQNR